MALTPVEQVRLLIGLTPNSPFYDFISDEQIEWFLEYTDGDVLQAARMAAIAVSFQLAGVNTREITGDIQVYNEISSRYLQALDNFINDPTVKIPSNLIPWAHAIQMCNLTNNKPCDGDECKDECACLDGCSTCRSGETF